MRRGVVQRKWVFSVRAAVSEKAGCSVDSLSSSTRFLPNGLLLYCGAANRSAVNKPLRDWLKTPQDSPLSVSVILRSGREDAYCVRIGCEWCSVMELALPLMAASVSSSTVGLMLSRPL
jgi:hypothetical protein